MVPATRSVIVGIGHGKQAARHIDAWLRQDTPAPEPTQQPAEFSQLNTWYYSDAPHAVRPRLESARRTSDFTEVVGGLDADTALYEARRCMSCGNCFSCDNCFGICPTTPSSRSTAHTATPLTTTTAKAAGSACPSAHAAQSPWSQRSHEVQGLRPRRSI
jgi:hypothetical protein